MEKEVPEYLVNRLKRWGIISNILRFVHVGLAIIAIVSSLLVTSQITEGTDFPKELFAFIAALAVGLLSSLDLGTKSNNFRRAWRALSVVILRYENTNEISIEKLITAYDNAENIIGDVNIKT